ncbi:MAG: YncE family protein [candidate division FCPU426 bacterium]
MPRSLLWLTVICIVLASGCARDNVVALSGRQEIVETGKQPFRLAPGLAPNRAVVSCFGGSVVQEISLAPLEVTATLDVLEGPQDLVLDQDQKAVYCLHTRENALAILEGEPLRVKRKARTGSLSLAGAAVRPQAGELWICDGTTGVSIFGMPCVCLQRKVHVGRYPQSILFTPDGQEAWVTLKGENAVVVLDTKTLAEKRRVTVGIYPQAILLAGNTVCVANAGSKDVSLIDRVKYEERARIRVFKQPQALALRGRTLWVACGRSFRLAVIDVAQARLFGTLRTGFYPGDILAMKDGSLVVTAPEKNRVVRITPEMPAQQ